MLRTVASWSSFVGLASCVSCAGTDSLPNHGGVVTSAAGGNAGSGGAAMPGAIGGSAGAPGGAAGAVGGSAGRASGGAPSAGAAGAAGAVSAPNDAASKAALEQLKAWLALEADSRPDLALQAFAKAALTKSDAVEAQQLLVTDYTTRIKATRASEVGATESAAKTLQLGTVSMKYYRAQRGKKPATGWNLFISMHGGGNAAAATNDEQWQNQLSLVDGYEPKDAIWIAPRAPTDEWNMWFREHVDGLFERLIADLIAFDGVDSNHVYLNGYSAGGDGAYMMGPRMADAWAGVGMSAGHPNDASPLSLRNTAYDRNLKGAEWGMKLDALAAADSGGYVHQWQVHTGKPHWMDMEDAVSIPFMQAHARDPIPKKVVWRQSGTLRTRFYWLAVAPADVAAGSEVTAVYSGQTIDLSALTKVKQITLRISDAMLDLDRAVSVKRDGVELFSGIVPRTIAVLYSTLADRGDPNLMFSGEHAVKLE